MKIAIGCDHGGFDLKESLKNSLKEKGYDCHDFGAVEFDSQDDYVEYCLKTAEAVASGECDRGIVICGTGIGMSILANKVSGVRAALCYTIDTAEISREHNDANVLALGGRILAKELALSITVAWLETPFSEAERHIRRIRKVRDMETQR